MNTKYADDGKTGDRRLARSRLAADDKHLALASEPVDKPALGVQFVLATE